MGTGGRTASPLPVSEGGRRGPTSLWWLHGHPRTATAGRQSRQATWPANPRAHWALGRAQAGPVWGHSCPPCPCCSVQAADAPSCEGPPEATLVDLDLPAAPAGPVSTAARVPGRVGGLVTGHGCAVLGASRLQGAVPPGSGVG